MTEVNSSKYEQLDNQSLSDSNSLHSSFTTTTGNDHSRLPGQLEEKVTSTNALQPSVIQNELALLKWTTSIHATKEDFEEAVTTVKQAIRNSISPTRIRQGTSGSYFLKDSSYKIIGVFKPSDEEQYSKNNPNLLKKLQRFLFPCFFGRSCLVSNTCCICEAAAYRVDKLIGLDMVPVTQLVYLSSQTFNYKKKTRNACLQQEQQLPAKLGSLQLFAEGYQEAKTFFRSINHQMREELLADKTFLFEFQKMVILDYIIRNTDRGMDNWLIRRQKIPIPLVKIVAIDHGLSFPYRHPSQCRSFPYSWAKMPYAKVPFMEEIRSLFQTKISNLTFSGELEQQLQIIFEASPHFRKELFQKQMEIVRGQMVNIADALNKQQTPEQLVKKQLVLVQKETIIEKICEYCQACSPKSTSPTVKIFITEIGPNEKQPTFKCTCERSIRWKKVAVDSEPLCSCCQPCVLVDGCCGSKSNDITQQTLSRYQKVPSTEHRPIKDDNEGPVFVPDDFNKWMHYTKEEEQNALHDAQRTIYSGKLPQKTKKGTSGTYMLKNSSGQIIAVFKPGEEETYGPRNPRTSKRFQRVLAPCTYKRKGLLKNAGYLCEVAASKVDKIFELYLVPNTILAQMSCPAFYWNCSERRKYKKCNKYPAKVGSFQLFVHNFTDASKLMKPLTWSTIAKYGYPIEFMEEFQRLVILDYLIRNTDRHSDNWLIKYSTGSTTTATTNNKRRANNGSNLLQAERVKIAAIDHGLSFPHSPYKPSQFKFGWLRFPCSRIPFLPSIINQYGPILRDDQKQNELDDSLYKVFRNYKHFDKETFQNQLALLKGQKRNILIAFNRGYSPLQLALMPSYYWGRKG